MEKAAGCKVRRFLLDDAAGYAPQCLRKSRGERPEQRLKNLPKADGSERLSREAISCTESRDSESRAPPLQRKNQQESHENQPLDNGRGAGRPPFGPCVGRGACAGWRRAAAGADGSDEGALWVAGHSGLGIMGALLLGTTGFFGTQEADGAEGALFFLCCTAFKKKHYICTLKLPSPEAARTTKGEVQEWLNWPAWKASKRQKRFRGSNPLLSAVNADYQ